MQGGTKSELGTQGKLRPTSFRREDQNNQKMLEKPLMVHMTTEQELNRIPQLPCILVLVTLFPGNVARNVYSSDVVPQLVCTLLSGFLKDLQGIWSAMCRTALDYFSPFSLQFRTAEELGAQVIKTAVVPPGHMLGPSK